MQTKDKAASALLAAFPTPEAWTAFSQNGDLSLIRDTFLVSAFDPARSRRRMVPLRRILSRGK